MSICCTVHMKGKIKILQNSEIKLVLVAALGEKEADGFAPDLSKRFDQDTVIDFDHSFGDCRNFTKTDTIHFKLEGFKERLNLEKDLNLRVPSLKSIWDKLPDITINIKEIKFIDFSAEYQIEIEVGIYSAAQNAETDL